MFYGMDPGAEHGFKLQHLLMFKILEKVKLQSKVCGEPSSAIRWSSEAGSLQPTACCSRPSSDEHLMKQVQGSRSLRSALRGQKSGCTTKTCSRKHPIVAQYPAYFAAPLTCVASSKCKIKRPTMLHHKCKQN